MKESWPDTSFNKALTFAAAAHQGQTMPGSDLPYLVHLSRVAMEVMIALHTKPDLDHSLAIQALTKDKSLPKAEAMADSLARIKKQPQEIWMVKMADRIANLGPPPDYWDVQKILTYRDEAMRIHDELKGANEHLAERLKRKIMDYRK